MQVMNVNDKLIQLSQGVTQGSVLSPNLFNVYLDHLTDKDKFLHKKKMATRRIVEATREGGSPAQTECIGLKYADDMVWEFESLEELQRWDCSRD